MPIPVIKYYCKYRCGRKASDLKSTIEHEKICFRNPETKSCRTCIHFNIPKKDIEQPFSIRCELKNLELVSFIEENFKKRLELWEGEDQNTIWTNEIEDNMIFDVYPKESRIFPTTRCPDWDLKS